MQSACLSDPPLGQISLLEHLDVSQITCLNEEGLHALKPVLAAKTLNAEPDVYLESSADAQLLLNIHVSRGPLSGPGPALTTPPSTASSTKRCASARSSYDPPQRPSAAQKRSSYS